MGWIETLTKEAFIAAVREAVKPDIERIEGKIDKLEAQMDARFEKLGGRVEVVENRVGVLAERVAHLEGDLSGAIRAWEANWREHEARAEARDANQRSMFLEFQRNIEREIFTRLLDDKKRPAA